MRNVRQRFVGTEQGHGEVMGREGMVYDSTSCSMRYSVKEPWKARSESTIAGEIEDERKGRFLVGGWREAISVKVFHVFQYWACNSSRS